MSPISQDIDRHGHAGASNSDMSSGAGAASAIGSSTGGMAESSSSKEWVGCPGADRRSPPTLPPMPPAPAAYMMASSSLGEPTGYTPPWSWRPQDAKVGVRGRPGYCWEYDGCCGGTAW